MRRTVSGPRAPLPPGVLALLATLLLGVFIGALDLAIVAPALSTIGGEFAGDGVDDRALTWLFTAFVLAAVAGLPLMGKLSDRYGRRPVFMLCIGLFALGSLLATLAPSFGSLVLARVIQGFGSGGLFPVAAAVIGDVIPLNRRGVFLGLTGSVWGLATIIGPPLGGIITSVAGWRWIFAVNLPICLLVLLLALRTLPAVRRVVGPFDWAGLVLLTAALSLVTWGLVQLDPALPLLGLGQPSVGGSLVLALLLGAGWVLVERRAADPIVRLSLLGRRQLALANGLSLGIGLTEASLLFLPTFVALRLGVDVLTASLFSLVGALALLVGTPITGALIDRLGSRIIIIGGALLTAVGMFWVGTMANDTLSFILALAVGGIGLSALLGTPIRYIVTGAAGPEDRSVALAVQSICTTTGIAVGSALTGAIVGAAAGDPLAGYGAAYVAIGIVALGQAGVALFLKGRREERAAAEAGQAAAPASVATPT